ncbi:MAG: ribosome assembly cofactor RimP [Bacteroidota bacterium]|nr:ribosome assembly cofactor RimP [Bacteroidota bacterium]
MKKYYLCTLKSFLIVEEDEGTKSPLFYSDKMIQKEKIEALADNFLENQGMFVVDIRVQSGNRILVFMDGDGPVTIDDCQKLSRYLESALDREKEDFELTVSSAGADRPLVLPRQFPKHIGRMISVKTKEGELLEGILKSTHEDGIEIEIEINIPGKKKEKTTVCKSLPFNELASVNVVLSFHKK